MVIALERHASQVRIAPSDAGSDRSAAWQIDPAPAAMEGLPMAQAMNGT
jgi:hypothetical protein